MIITISSRIHLAITHLSRTPSFVPAHTHGGYGMWGGVGGWVGGDNDVRYNYLTHCVRRWSSPFHHAFIVPLLTSHALHHSFPHIRMEGMVWGGGWVGGWVGGIHILLAVAPQLRHGSLAKRSWPVPCLKKDLPAAVPGWSIELWFLIPEHIFHWWWTMIETTKNTTAATADVTLFIGVWVVPTETSSLSWAAHVPPFLRWVVEFTEFDIDQAKTGWERLWIS